MRSLNLVGEADYFLFRGLPPLQGDEKVGGAFSSDADSPSTMLLQASNSFAFTALSGGGGNSVMAAAFQAESTHLPLLLLPKLYFGKSNLGLDLATRAIASLRYCDRKGARLLP
jgi:hypothetical protein